MDFDKRSPWLALLIASAIAVRWLFCFAIFPQLLAAHSTVGTEYYFDSYREIAASLVEGCGYALGCGGAPALHRPPGYVMFMLLTDPADAKRSFIYVHLFNGILGGLAVWLTYLAARAWKIATRGALFAAAVVAFWPFLIWETKVTVPENLLVALIPAVLFFVRRARAFYFSAIALGLLAGATALTHASYQTLIVALLPALIWRRVSKSAERDARAHIGRRLAHTAVVVIAFLAVVVPWAARNQSYGYGGIASGFGYHYWKGVYDFNLLRTGGDYFRDNDIPATAFVDRMLKSGGFDGIDTNEERSDPEINHYLDRSAIEHAREHAGYTTVKTIVMMPLAWVQQQSGIRALFTAILLLPLFALGALGLRRRRDLWPVAIALLIMNAAVAAVFVEAMPMRYALPLMPVVGVLAGAWFEERAV